jgi:transmembrane sensor
MTDYHKISLDYFEGRIAPADEALLREFLLSPENREQFHAWENEWMMRSAADESTERAWKRFKLQQNARELAKSQKQTRLNFRWWYAAAAAVALLLGVVGLWAFISENDAIETEPCYAVEAAQGQKSKVQLADGSVVYLNAKSRLVYDSKFNVENRCVQLVGEGYFEVAKNAELPFVVEVGDDYTVTVTGTKFNVSAYAEDDQITTSLFEGSVRVVCGDSVFHLTPSDELRYCCSSSQFEHLRSDESPMMWVHNQLVYDDISVGELFNRLSRQYGITLVSEVPDIEDEQMRIALRNHEKIEEVLVALEQVLPIDTRLKNDTLFVTEN